MFQTASTQILGPSLWSHVFSFFHFLGKEMQPASQKVGITHFCHCWDWTTHGSVHRCMHIPYSCTWPWETSQNTPTGRWQESCRVSRGTKPEVRSPVSLSLMETESVYVWSSFATQDKQSLNMNVLLPSVHFPGWLWTSNLNLEKVFMWTPSHHLFA